MLVDAIALLLMGVFIATGGSKLISPIDDSNMVSIFACARLVASFSSASKSMKGKRNRSRSLVCTYLLLGFFI